MTAPYTETDLTRDPEQTARRAFKNWTAWQPGDGSKYTVKLDAITDGPDHGDMVLLVSIEGRTVGFQFPLVSYRAKEARPWNGKRCQEEGIPPWVAKAAMPLMRAARQLLGSGA